MFINFKKKDLIGKNFTSNLFKHNDFIVFYGDFYLDGKLFFPISIKHKAGSSELFGNLAQIKYNKYFENDFYKDTLIQHDSLQILENSMILGSSGNYYHDLIDFYSKIFSYDNKIDDNIDKIIIGNLSLKDPIITLLKKINIQKKVFSIDSNTKIFKNSYFVSNKNLLKINDFYRLLFFENSVKQTKNIYISRKDSNIRSIKNEQEIVNYLKRFDFEVYELSKLNFLEQIKLFNEAKIIISMHGAGLTNLIFCNPETLVIEITPDFFEQYKLTNLKIDTKQFIYLKENKTDWFSEINSNKFNKYTRSVFNYLSHINGLNHYYYFVKSIELKNNKKIFFDYEFKATTHTDLTVNMSVFKNFLSSKIK